MFHENDPRTYAIPLTRTLETLQQTTKTPLTDPHINDTLTEIKTILNNTFDTVTTSNNTTGEDITPSNRYLPTYHMTDTDLTRWVEYNAAYGIQETKYGTQSRVELELIIPTNGELFIRATTRPKPTAPRSRLYAGKLSNFTATDAAIAATQAYGNTVATMTEDGLTGSEIIDNRALDLHKTTPENWAHTRNVTYEAVRKNREKARQKLRDNNWPPELTTKPTDTIDDIYKQINDEHGTLIIKLTETLLNELPGRKQTPEYKAALTVALYETFTPAMRFDDTTIPDYQLFTHRLGEMPINAETHAKLVRLLVNEPDAMDVNTFRETTDDMFYYLTDAHPENTPLNELTH